MNGDLEHLPGSWDQHGDASRHDEEREFLIGYTLSPQLLVVIYQERGERKRIISAWRATRHQRRLYESG